MDVLSDLLRIKVFREQKAERALAIARLRVREAEQHVVDARRLLQEFLDDSRRREKALYAELCSKLVLLRDINNVQIDVQLMKERSEELSAELQRVTEHRDAMRELEREAREQHRFAVRMREKFAEMLRTVQEERDFELSRFEELELEEAAETRFASRQRGDPAATERGEVSP